MTDKVAIKETITIRVSILNLLLGFMYAHNEDLADSIRNSIEEEL